MHCCIAKVTASADLQWCSDLVSRANFSLAINADWSLYVLQSINAGFLVTDTLRSCVVNMLALERIHGWLVCAEMMPTVASFAALSL